MYKATLLSKCALINLLSKRIATAATQKHKNNSN